jgi:RNA polymerase sigma-32 factor
MSFDPLPAAGEEEDTYGPAAYLSAPESDPAQQVENEDWEHDSTAQLASGLKNLDARSRTIVQRRWLASPKATLHELADEFGVSAERIRQIEAAAFTRLRGLLPAPAV